MKEPEAAPVRLQAALEVLQSRISCTASYSMIFSSTKAGVRQSMRLSSRNPRLNHARRR